MVWSCLLVHCRETFKHTRFTQKFTKYLFMALSCQFFSKWTPSFLCRDSMKSFVLQREKRNSVSSTRVLTIIVVIEITHKHNIASRSQILGWILGGAPGALPLVQFCSFSWSSRVKLAKIVSSHPWSEKALIRHWYTKLCTLCQWLINCKRKWSWKWIFATSHLQR